MAPPKGTLLFKTGERCPRTILVCDMPERKQFNQRRWRPVHYVADVAQMPRLSVRGHKKWPRKPGPLVESIGPRGLQRKRRQPQKPCIYRVSETEIGEVPIALRGAGRGHQHTIDGGHQAAKQGGEGREADGGSLGHCRPLSKPRRIAASGLGTIYVYQIPGTMRLFAWQQFPFCNAT